MNEFMRSILFLLSKKGWEHGALWYLWGRWSKGRKPHQMTAGRGRSRAEPGRRRLEIHLFESPSSNPGALLCFSCENSGILTSTVSETQKLLIEWINDLQQTLRLSLSLLALFQVIAINEGPQCGRICKANHAAAPRAHPSRFLVP